MLERSVRRHVQAVPLSAVEVRVSNEGMHMQLVMCFDVQPRGARDVWRERTHEQ